MNKGLSTVWYTYTASASDTAISFDTKGTDYDTFIAVWISEGSTPGDDYLAGTLTPITCNNDSGGPQSSVGFQTTASTTYYIEVGQYDGTIGTSSTSFNASSPLESERAK